jgi:hypothetical protein
MSPIDRYVADAREAELASRLRERPRTIGDRPIKRRFRFHHLLVTVVVAAAAAWPLTPLAHAGPAEPTVPTRLQVPDGNKLFLVGHAVGVQIYVCNATADGYAWRLVAPRATLYGDNGKPIAAHFGGPTWQATDGSTVVGQRVDGVTVDRTAIPWLLLSAASHSAGPDGARLAETTFIQRIATSGGLMPAAEPCDAAAAGTQNEVPYSADYYFWKATGA